MTDNDDSAELIEQVRQAADNSSPIKICGGNSKQHLSDLPVEQIPGTELSVLKHCGVIDYDPTELVISVRAGTSLSDLNQILDDAGQMLPFGPPGFAGSTIGGVLACGLSGPRRPFNGSARDYVLGTRVINGLAQDLSFGGKVMKNVAGYDVSRVQVGAWGTLGVLLDISMKVLPKPALEITVEQTVDGDGLGSFAALLRKPLPLSGAMLIKNKRYLRLSGSALAVESAANELGGERVANAGELWTSVRDHTHEFFQLQAEKGETLWRISVADHAPALNLQGEWLQEWAGAQRWLKSTEAAEQVFAVVQAANGHATRYSSMIEGQAPCFQPIEGALQKLQCRLRDSFDPQRLFNRGRFHPELDISAADQPER